MRLFRSLPLGLILIITDASLSSANVVPRAIDRLRDVAHRQTKRFAHDLRVAFGAVLVTQPDTPNSRVVYCKSGSPSSIGAGGGGSGNGTSRSPLPSGTTTSTSVKSSSSPVPSSPWKLLDSHAGSSFFDGWSFYTSPDPTHGIVQFVDQNTGRSSGILSVNSNGNAIMGVETTATVPANRQSIRITTNTSYNNGALFIMDAVHMPAGCGTWPAFWTNGPNWPAGGEIDIVEGVNDYTNNQATLHTNPGCTMSSTNSASLSISGNALGGTDCSATNTGNTGCGIRASTNNSFGAGFNANGGGVYAMQWDGSGISIFFFPRGTEPSDIAAGAPHPENWGAAQARWPASGCDPFKFFNSQNAIFDTTLCGDWAGSVWNNAGIPGQEQSCAQRTGYSTCEAFVRASGSSFNEAYWEVRSVKVYQTG
ncbi:hypothetical protein L208DRAFT_1242607 [Tricholoma matsutake]|nr:hypothetical protein L208DRAFT_1242607 [Tricholoma matsutake 945]